MKIIAKNRKSRFNFELLDKYLAGIVLTGSEIKSIRANKLSINEAYCFMKDNELFVKNMHIAEYKQASYNNHEPLRIRKLLLKTKELEKINKSTQTKGLTIIPTSVIMNDRGFVKIKIAIGKGKKIYDKRQDIKNRDIKKTIDRNLKQYR